MNEIYDFLVANKIVVGGSLAGIALFWDRLVVLYKTIIAKIPKLKKLPLPIGPTDDEEAADQAAIKHLRIRASAVGNEELMGLIKEIDAKFYDIHTGTKNE